MALVTEADPGEWNALNARSGGTVFQGFEWNAAQAATLAPGERPLVLSVRDEGRLVGLAPLKITEEQLFGRSRPVIEFLAFPRADYCDVLADPASADAIARLMTPLFEQTPAWDMVRLANIPDDSRNLEALRAAFDCAGFPVDVSVLADAPTCILTPDAAHDITRKKSLKRHYNHFKREGSIALHHYDRAEDIDPWLDRFFAQHVARRAMTASPSVFTDPGQRAALRTMVGLMAPGGRLLFSVLVFREEPIAFHLGFMDDQRLIWYIPTFDVAYIRHSPGEVLLKLLLEHAIERGCNEFDFGIGEEDYKYRFSNHVRRVCCVEAFRSPALARARRLLSDAKAFVRRSDTLSRFARQTLQAFR